jgi:3'(2'), 5'-bisphosphate nucleotidase
LDYPDEEDIVAADYGYLHHINYSVPEALETLENDRLVLWIDPLDGTKKFAAKQFDEVSVLIGISYDKRPIAGVMHLPFHGEHGTTFWGK